MRFIPQYVIETICNLLGLSYKSYQRKNPVQGHDFLEAANHVAEEYDVPMESVLKSARYKKGKPSNDEKSRP